jgi:hypothetical protein
MLKLKRGCAVAQGLNHGTICFSPRRISLGFVVQNMALERVLSWFSGFFLVIIIPRCSTVIHSCIKDFVKCLGVVYRWGRDFPHPFRPALGPGRGADHPPHLCAGVMKGYSYISTHPLGLRGLLYGKPLPLPLSLP